MAKTDSLMHIGHRERLRLKFDAGNASPADEMELLLTYIIPRRDVRVLARLLVQKFGSVYNTILADGADIMSVDGAGPAVASFFNLLRNVVGRGYKQHLVEHKIFYDPRIIHEYCRTQVTHKSVEELHAIYLDHEHRLLADKLVSMGTVDYAVFYPREIIIHAIQLKAAYVVLYHNHPVGGGSFSSDDIAFTISLGKMLKFMGIKLYDHYVVGATGSVYSMHDLQMLREIDNIKEFTSFMHQNSDDTSHTDDN